MSYASEKLDAELLRAEKRLTAISGQHAYNYATRLPGGGDLVYGVIALRRGLFYALDHRTVAVPISIAPLGIKIEAAAGVPRLFEMINQDSAAYKARLADEAAASLRKFNDDILTADLQAGAGS